LDFRHQSGKDEVTAVAELAYTGRQVAYPQFQSNKNMKYVKQILSILGVTTIAACVAFAADQPMGNVIFQNTPLDKILPVYQEMSGCQLIESSDVKKHYRQITVRATAPASKADTLRLIEKALLEQAGIVITHLDDKRVSVTFNDRLPIASVKP
jgi:hypothetical protein